MNANCSRCQRSGSDKRGPSLGSLALLSVVETMARGQGGRRLRYTGATAMALSVMETEIRSQPAMLARLAEDAAPLVRELGRAVARRRPRFVVLAARGSSDHAAIYGKYLLETQAGLVASLAAPSVYSVYGRSPDVRDALTIGISQSGQSPDIVSAIEEPGARARSRSRSPTTRALRSRAPPTSSCRSASGRSAASRRRRPSRRSCSPSGFSSPRSRTPIPRPPVASPSRPPRRSPPPSRPWPGSRWAARRARSSWRAAATAFRSRSRSR